ncbi:MAG: metalloregulator ArsR/SmtB family transcription factor [Sphingopyxis sp.]
MSRNVELSVLKRDAKMMATYLKLIAHPERLLMLCQMDENETSVSDLISLSGLSQSAVSQHLAKLRDAGVVSSRGDAQTRYYRLSDPRMRKIIAALCMACEQIDS